jgi:hypothetical protein
MPDRIALPLLVLIAAAMIGLALVWPQGQGAESPPPFGQPLAPMAQPTAPRAPSVPVKSEPKPSIRP